MNAAEVSRYLAKNALAVCEWVLPTGKKCGKEWRIGATDGSKGKSLSVCVSGEKSGVWKDFADSSKGGDLLDLICAVQGVGIQKAMEMAAERFGFSLTPKFVSKQVTYVRPDRPKSITKPTDPVMEFLAGRGINEKTASLYRVAANVKGSSTYIALPYIRDGELINIKERNIDDKKDTRQQAGAEPCLFGWHTIDPSERFVVITEGEFDSMILTQCGIPALSCNAGVNNLGWIENDYAALERFSRIVIWYDSDEAGQKAAPIVGKRLGEERVMYVKSELKDANDTFLSGGAEAVFAELERAKARDPEELKCASDFRDELMAEFFDEPASVGAMLDVGVAIPQVVFRPQEVTTWTGTNGHGKSMFVSQQIVSFARQGYRTCIFSGEMPAKKTLKRMVRQHVKSENPAPTEIDSAINDFAGMIFLFDHFGAATIDRLIEVFTYASRRYGVQHFVIDSLMTTDVPEDGNGFLEKQRVAMAKLVEFANRTDSHVHLVAHPRKVDENTPPSKSDIGGSSKIASLSHNVFTVFSTFSQDKGVDAPDGRVILYKQRNGDLQYKDFWFEYDKGTMLFSLCAPPAKETVQEKPNARFGRMNREYDHAGF